MYAVLLIPNFFLQAQLRRQRELWDSPVALLEVSDITLKDRGKARILQATDAALAHGVELGMTATQGQARCGRLQLLYRSPDDEQAAESTLLEVAERWSPDFEATAPGVCTLDLLGNAEAHSQTERLGKQMVSLLFDHHLQAQIGFAAHPDLALLAAQQAAPVFVIGDEDTHVERFLNQLPILTLALSPDLREILRLWGIRTLGELRALPANEVIERLGPDAVDLLEKSQGKRRRLLKLVRPPTLFIQQMEFEHAIETLEPLLFIVRRMLEKLSARLATIHLVAGNLTLTLDFADGETHQREFTVPDPSRDVDLLFRILHTHLETLTAEAPMVKLTLEITPSRSLTHQFELFASSLRDPNRFAETLARLEALLGNERIGTPEPLATHRPDAFVMKPFREATQDGKSRRKPKKPSPIEAAHETAMNTMRLGLPLRRFRPPEPISVMSAQQGPVAILSGQVQGSITQQRGPWLLSGEWWHQHSWAFKEWDVQLEDGGIHRIAEVKSNSWLLIGTYG